MNLGKFCGPSSIVIFTWIWVLGSIFAASYFSFSLFPSLSETMATIYFQTKANDSAGVVYWPNSSRYRQEHLFQLFNSSQLFVSKCDVLPLSAQRDCDDSKNWYPLDAKKDLGCRDVPSCTKTKYRIPKDLIAAFSKAVPISGQKIPIKDPVAVSFSDPATWGETGEWPVFFVALFFSFKLGRSVGEFLFVPYEKK